MRISSHVELCTAHRLMDYPGKCKHLHGHNYKVAVDIELNFDSDSSREFGILLDFDTVKRALKAVTDPFDHATVLRNDDPLRYALLEHGQQLILLSVNPTAENLAEIIATRVAEYLDLSPMRVVATVHETSKCYVEASGVSGLFSSVSVEYYNVRRS